MQKKRICLMLGILFFSFIFTSQNVHAWLSGWNYRRNITINNTQNSNTLTDYQVAINLTYSSNMQPDFSDIRFTNSSDSLLSYWIESKVDSAWAYVWVKVDNIPASSTTTIYVYYGNTTPVTSQSNGTATFPQFDDFSTNTTSSYTMLRQSNSGTFALNWNSTDYTAYDTVTSTYGDVNWVKASFGAGYSIRGSVRNASTTTRGGFAFIVGSGNYDTLAGIALYADYPACGLCGFYFNDSSGSAEPAKKLTEVTNGFHTLEIANPNSSTWMIRADNATWFSFTLSMTGTLYPSLRDRPQSSTAKSVWDWWFVRKFSDPEPTYSIGVEKLSNQPPQITIYQPLNQTYFYSNNFIFNFSVSDDRSSTFWIRAYLDNNLIYENTSYQNNTIIILTQNLTQAKSYNFTVWANDTDTFYPQTSTLTVIFAIKDFEIQQITFNSIVYETTTQSFMETIRVNFDFVSDIPADLIWNGTDYGTAAKTYNSTHFILTKQITIPFIDPLNTTVNFYFLNNISYINGTWQIVNSTANQQTIYRMYLDNCVASSAQTLQLKAYDEETKSQITPNTTQLQIMIWKENQNLNRTYSLNSSTVCIYPAWSSYNATVYAQVTKDGYAMAEHYPYTLSLLSNTTQTLSLYMLSSSLASPITFQLPQENYILTVEKDYAGTFVYIRSTKADFNKNAVIYLRPYDTFYRIYVYTSDRQLCFQSSEFKVAASTYTVTSCNQMAAIPPPSFMYEANVNLTCTYINDTHTVYCEFYSLDDLDHNVTMYIYKYNKPFGRSLYYTQSIYGVSGSMQKQLDAGFEYDVRLEAHSDYQYFLFTVDTGAVTITEQSIFFLLLLLFIIGAIVGFIEPFAGMGIIIAGLLIAGGIGAIRQSYLAIAAISLMIILAYALRRR